MKHFLACCPLLAALTFSPLLAGQSIADEPAARPAPVQFLLGANLEYGGDEVLTLEFENGNEQTMRAGQGGTLFGGARFPIGKQFAIDASVGIKYVTTAADNLSLRFLRFPLETMFRYEPVGEFFLAGGVTKHVGNTFKVKDGGGILPEGKTNFSSNIGGRVEAGWRFIGLSYTFLEYRNESQPSNTLNANTVGLSLRYAFE